MGAAFLIRVPYDRGLFSDSAAFELPIILLLTTIYTPVRTPTNPKVY